MKLSQRFILLGCGTGGAALAMAAWLAFGDHSPMEIGGGVFFATVMGIASVILLWVAALFYESEDA